MRSEGHKVCWTVAAWAVCVCATGAQAERGGEWAGAVASPDEVHSGGADGLARALAELDAMARGGGDRSALWGVVGPGEAEALKKSAAVVRGAVGPVEGRAGGGAGSFAGAIAGARALAVEGGLAGVGEGVRVERARAVRALLGGLDGGGVSTAGEALRRVTLAWAMASEAGPGWRVDATALLNSVVELPVGADPSRTVGMGVRVEAMMGLIALAADGREARTLHAGWALELDSPAGRAADAVGAGLLAEALSRRLMEELTMTARGGGGAAAKQPTAEEVAAACGAMLMDVQTSARARQKLSVLTRALPVGALPMEVAAVRAMEETGAEGWLAASRALEEVAGAGAEAARGERVRWVVREAVGAGVRAGEGVRRGGGGGETGEQGRARVGRFVRVALEQAEAIAKLGEVAAADAAAAAALADAWWLAGGAKEWGAEAERVRAAAVRLAREGGGPGRWPMVMDVVRAELSRAGGAGGRRLSAQALTELSLLVGGEARNVGDEWSRRVARAIVGESAGEARRAEADRAWGLAETVAGGGGDTERWLLRAGVAREVAALGDAATATGMMERVVAEGSAARWAGVDGVRVELARLWRAEGRVAEAAGVLRVVTEPWEDRPAAAVRPAEVWLAWAELLEMLGADNADGRRTSAIVVRVRALRAIDPRLGAGDAGRRIEAVERGAAGGGGR